MARAIDQAELDLEPRDVPDIVARMEEAAQQQGLQKRDRGAPWGEITKGWAGNVANGYLGGTINQVAQKFMAGVGLRSLEGRAELRRRSDESDDLEERFEEAEELEERLAANAGPTAAGSWNEKVSSIDNRDRCRKQWEDESKHPSNRR